MMVRPFFLWLLAGLLSTFLSLLLGLLWYLLLPPLLVPVSYRFDPETGRETLTRKVLDGHDVTAIWHHAVTTPDDGECHAGGIGFYERQRDTASWQAPPTLEGCLRMPGSISRIEWYPLLWGILPMRPVRLIVTYDEATGALPPGHPPITKGSHP